MDYEPLPAVHDPTEALQPDAPRVHPNGNLVTQFEVTDGDLATGFAEADVIIAETFEVPRISPGYMEPETALAEWHADGTLTAWVSSQKPFEDQHQIARVLGLDADAVQV